MSAPYAGPLAPSLLGITIRRAAVSGRAYLIYGIGVSLFLAVSLGLSGGQAFALAFPVLFPIFGVTGSMGGLMVFTSDRLKGVLEYLMAYGLPPRRLFFNILLASFVLVTLVLAVGLGAGVGFYVARGHDIPAGLALLLGLYSVPMSYASVAFATAVGVYWTALSSPREGLNSPIGLVPLVGILPGILTLGLVLTLAANGALTAVTFVAVTGAAMGAMAVFVLLLLALMDRLLRRERLLSPA